VTLALSLLAACGFSCAGEEKASWQAPRVVMIESDKDVSPLFPSLLVWSTDASESGPHALLLRDEDYLSPDGGLPFRYRSSDGLSLKLTAGDGILKLGDVVVAVDVSQPKGLNWLEGASRSEMATLRTLGFREEIAAPAFAALKKLAAVNPNVDMVFEQHSDYILKILPLFHTRIASIKEAVDLALANRPEIDTVVIESVESGVFDALPGFPGLRRLVVTEDWDREDGPLPEGLSGLRSLTIMGDVKDLSVIAAAPVELEELTLGVDGLESLKGLERFKNLHTLLLLGGGSIDLTPLNQFTGLRRVALPSGTTDAQFAGFVNTHPDLAVLEMPKNDKVTSLEPLANLKRLEAIVINGNREDLGVLGQVKSLRFVGMSRGVEGEPVEALRKALPEAAIVAVKPFCLGSGWILALVPAVFVAWIIRRRRVQA
jgi:hypothetical protein